MKRKSSCSYVVQRGWFPYNRYLWLLVACVWLRCFLMSFLCVLTEHLVQHPPTHHSGSPHCFLCHVIASNDLGEYLQQPIVPWHGAVASQPSLRAVHLLLQESHTLWVVLSGAGPSRGHTPRDLCSSDPQDVFLWGLDNQGALTRWVLS